MSSIYIDLLGSQTRFIQGRKYTTRVIEAGEGEALVLMHGGGGHAESWTRNVARLAQDFRVLAIDFIWHGFSSKPPFRSGNWCKQFTEQVLDLLDTLDIQKAHIEGESLGGWIVFDMALNHPDRVRKAIANTAWGMKFAPGTVALEGADLAALRERSLAALASPSHETIRKRMEWLMASAADVTDELVECRSRIWSRPETRQSLSEYYDKLFQPEVDGYLFGEDDLQRIRVPMLVFWTDRNPFHGIDCAERLAQLIPNAQLHVMKNAAHWPQWEHPEEHDQVVRDFLKS